VASEIKSEITGKIWKVEASIGQKVAAEEQIVVIESMKMEIPVLAPEAGTISEIRVAEGDDVLEGQVIAVIDG
jgi:acetyl-CoA carboxylase biotin carboxyl carrier protein